MDEHRNNVGDGAQVTHSPKRTVPEILNAAADLLEKPGAWTQGALYRDAAGEPIPNFGDREAVCYCAEGAIAAVVGRYSLSHPAYAPLGGTGELSSWNDAPGRTQKEVVAALRQAAEKAARPTQEGA